MRTVPEWIGKTDDSAIPLAVRVRVFQRTGGRCAKCTRLLLPAHWECDHVIALINGGRHAENNLQALCSSPCHSQKTKADVAEKAIVYRKRAKHLGLRPKGRPMPGSKASGLRRRMDGTVERRT